MEQETDQVTMSASPQLLVQMYGVASRPALRLPLQRPSPEFVVRRRARYPATLRRAVQRPAGPRLPVPLQR